MALRKDVSRPITEFLAFSAPELKIWVSSPGFLAKVSEFWWVLVRFAG